jgi:serine/threonine protein kinase
MAPEVKSFQGYDSKADIYSIGALVYEMATGDVFVRNNEGFMNQTVLVEI